MTYHGIFVFVKVIFSDWSDFFFFQPYSIASSRFDSLDGFGSSRAPVGTAGMAQYAR